MKSGGDRLLEGHRDVLHQATGVVSSSVSNCQFGGTGCLGEDKGAHWVEKTLGLERGCSRAPTKKPAPEEVL